MSTREAIHLRRSDVRRVPWKNGRGVTEELAIWPEDAQVDRGGFTWRISKASIAGPGPFSSFPGYERILVVVEGRALVLTHGTDAPRARLRPLEPYLFSGDWRTEAELPEGPVVDLNVIVRCGRCSAGVEASDLGTRRLREPLEPGDAFVHVLAGGVRARVTGAEEPFELAHGESLWARGVESGDEVELAGKSAATRIVLVRLGRPPAPR